MKPSIAYCLGKYKLSTTPSMFVSGTSLKSYDCPLMPWPLIWCASLVQWYDILIDKRSIKWISSLPAQGLLLWHWVHGQQRRIWVLQSVWDLVEAFGSFSGFRCVWFSSESSLYIWPTQPVAALPSSLHRVELFPSSVHRLALYKLWCTSSAFFGQRLPLTALTQKKESRP